MSLGTNISRLRAEHHLSQGDLAEALDELVTGAAPSAEEAPPREAGTPPPQAVASGRLPGRKIAGLVLFCMAFLTFLVLTAVGGVLEGLILAMPFLVCGIICFLAQKRPGLWCAWAVYLLAYIICYYGTGLGWGLLFFTFSWEAIGIPAYTIAAWVQVLMILALLIGTVRSFRTFSFPPTRRNGVILAVLWVVFLVCWLLISPVLDLMLELGKSAVLIVVLIFTVQVLVSLILLAVALTLSVRMFAAWRASRR